MRSLVACLLLVSTAHGQDGDAILFPGDADLAQAMTVIDRQSSTSTSVSCSTPSSETGSCRMLYDCPGYSSLLPHLRDRRVMSFFKSRICRVFLRSVLICCPLSATPILPSGFGVPTPSPSPSPLPPTSLIPPLEECGSPSVDRITGGVEVQPGRWPWLAAVGERRTSGSFLSVCGGTLITIRHVLTAAHCFDIPGIDDPRDVRLGEHNLILDNDGAAPQDFAIVSRVGSGYNTATKENDIQLLTLDRDARFNDFVRPACLPFGLDDVNFVGQNLTVIGWGKERFGILEPTSDVPRQTNVPVVETEVCQTAYQRTVSRPLIDDRVLCAGIGVQDACSGDSGGPLNYDNPTNRKYYVVGLVSLAVECARPDFPGVYTRVTSFLQWIQNNLQ